jgi:long-chain acyl-CoA synthetase
MQYSVEVVGAPTVPGEGKPRRNTLLPDRLVAHPPGVTTLWENFLRGVRLSGEKYFKNSSLIPTHDIYGCIVVETFRRTYSLLSPFICIMSVYERIVLEGGDFLGTRRIENGVAKEYVWQTYPEVQTRVNNFGAGLTNLGLATNKPFGFFLINCAEWVNFFHA